MVTTRGDEVRTYATTEALQQLLGTIDTEQEAVLLAFASGYDVCSSGGDFPPRVGVNPDDGFTVRVSQGVACGKGSNLYQQALRITSSGELVKYEPTVLKYGDETCYVGRRPVGLQDARSGACEDPRGRYFAEAARLEAASIHAFLRLHDELKLHGADVALQDAALASAVDEVRHTDVTRRLTLRFGAVPPAPSVAELPLRPLTEVLLDNAVEGCVRETYGALLAHHQALHARDPEIRKAMSRIAEDETRHAGLSWDIAGWAAPRLSVEDQAALHKARRQAVAVLRAEVAVPLDAELTADAGLPSAEVGLAMLDSLEQALWA
ncbi:ferritin-like domain-containing protein [Corallococcus sp. CA053C]|uniref:ferritin-like domain-containing protein n=1 Tax=Corallococcus sp. CA053C TaxID=2316732 RepID=UPI001F4644CE|nr:ferritin-like domain-containing protein [Corallococcus sp. CA053C]